MKPFTKPPFTYAQQVSLLRSRGMEIIDTAEAEFYLQHLNYYRLGAYWLPSHMNPGLARDPRHWQTNLDTLRNEVERSDEIFIKHLTSAYSESLPPIWAVCEVMSLGLLSRWYRNLGPMQTRRAISDVYQADEQVLESWLHHLTTIRNTCAHHSRLWNREFTVTPKLPRTKPPGLAKQFHQGSRRIYNTLVILLHCLDTLAPHHHWRSELKALLARHDIPVAAMGFPDAWGTLDIWR